MSDDSPPVDLTQLARYTGGETALDAEILQLFAGQSADLLRQLQAALEAGDDQNWRLIAHSLKGAARGIGAFALADAASGAESFDPSSQKPEASDALGALRETTAAVQAFIAAHLAAGGA